MRSYVPSTITYRFLHGVTERFVESCHAARHVWGMWQLWPMHEVIHRCATRIPMREVKIAMTLVTVAWKRNRCDLFPTVSCRSCVRWRPPCTAQGAVTLNLTTLCLQCWASGDRALGFQTLAAAIIHLCVGTNWKLLTFWKATAKSPHKLNHAEK